jgi:hypothetical protein
LGKLIARTVLEMSATLNYWQLIRIIQGAEMGGTYNSNGRGLK